MYSSLKNISNSIFSSDLWTDKVVTDVIYEFVDRVLSIENKDENKIFVSRKIKKKYW